MAAVIETQKCYDGNRLGDGIGWRGGAGKISEDCPRWMEGWCEAVKWEMGMSLAGGEGARERRRGRRPMAGKEQGGTPCGLCARVTLESWEEIHRSLGVMWCDNVPLAELIAKALRQLPD